MSNESNPFQYFQMMFLYSRRKSLITLKEDGHNFKTIHHFLGNGYITRDSYLKHIKGNLDQQNQFKKEEKILEIGEKSHHTKHVKDKFSIIIIKKFIRCFCFLKGGRMSLNFPNFRFFIFEYFLSFHHPILLQHYRTNLYSFFL